MSSVTNCKIFTIILVANYVSAVAGQAYFELSNETLETLFEKTEFPITGDIPMLNRKVFRGMRVTVAEHPYVASVRRLTAHYLTATLLTKNLLVTVAHPLHNVSPLDLSVVVGENYSDRGTTLLTVVFLLFHEDFDPSTLAADIVLLRIFEDIQYRASVKPISLASWTDTLEGRTAFVTGWGRCDRMGTELCLPRSSRDFRSEKLDPMLRTIKFTLTPSKHCEEYRQHELKLDDKMLCVGTARADDLLGPCMAVPGAPLVVGARLVGLQSWGFGCGYLGDMPLVYTNIEQYHSWILHNIPIIRKITKMNLTYLFSVIKFQKISAWLYQSRLQFLTERPSSNYELQALRVDRDLAKLRGIVYDVRDFIYNGMFHNSKDVMYLSLKQSQQSAAVAEENKLRKRVTVVPFLSNVTLDEVNMVLRNGTLAEIEASTVAGDESGDKAVEAEYEDDFNSATQLKPTSTEDNVPTELR